jgi:hypothetical protein
LETISKKVGIAELEWEHQSKQAEFTLPVVTGPVTVVTGLTGLDRLRYRPVTNRWVQKFLNLNSKN